MIENPQKNSTLKSQVSKILESMDQLTGSWSERPSWDAYFMATAMLMASRSSCERLHVGCVIVSAGAYKNRVIAAGYNGFLPGADHVSHLRDGHEQATVHAEQNAISDAARRGVSLGGAVAYVTHYPCVNCAKILAAAGVRMVKYYHNYRNDSLVQTLLTEAGVEVVQL
ncbi:MAG: tRNA-specific adenosine deaminase [Opitutia bacterium UBA7350]|nr:MAG: tRNA-specific adenosine deaminase [Opitutae bacterium UBA7350]